MKRESKEWFKKAEEDYKVVQTQSLWSQKLYNIICFHGHQYIEKCLKAILFENNIQVEKTHDLELLYHKCKHLIPEIEKYKKELIYLTQFSVRIRYPGFSVSSVHAKKTKQIVDKMRKIFESYFKKNKT